MPPRKSRQIFVLSSDMISDGSMHIKYLQRMLHRDRWSFRVISDRQTSACNLDSVWTLKRNGHRFRGSTDFIHKPSASRKSCSNFRDLCRLKHHKFMQVAPQLTILDPRSIGDLKRLMDT
jgi:hypothetical protein